MAYGVALNSALLGYSYPFRSLVVGYLVYGVARRKAQYLTVIRAVSTQ